MFNVSIEPSFFTFTHCKTCSIVLCNAVINTSGSIIMKLGKKIQKEHRKKINCESSEEHKNMNS
jgi:hypothetical protein